MESLANVNGTITKSDEAVISIHDRGFLYGDSIYEVFRTYDGFPFLFDEHLDRLENSASLAGIKISQSREFLTSEIRRTIQSCGLQAGEDVYVRYTITRGRGPIDLDPTLDLTSSYIILVKQVPNWNPRFFSEGVKLAVPLTRRNSHETLSPNIKSGNYLNNIIGVGQAKEKQADDALFFTLDGFAAECSNSNILFVEDSKVITPRKENSNLRGLTRVVIEEICRQNNISFLEQNIEMERIQQTQEAFISSATREIMPVISIILENNEAVRYPTGGGKITKFLQEKFKQIIQTNIRQQQQHAFF